MIPCDYISSHKLEGKTNMRWRIYIRQSRCYIKFSHLKFYLLSPGKVINKFNKHSRYGHRKHDPKKPRQHPAYKNRQNYQKRGDPDSFPHDQWVNKMVFKLLDDYIQDKDGYTKNRFLSERNSDRRHCGYYRAKYCDNLLNKMVFKLLDDYIQDKDGYTKNRFLSERNSDRRHCGYYRAKYCDNLQN